MADINTYGQADIKRYLQHHMSPQEMHAFEKALMDDPFLADALEGYRASDLNRAETDLQQIEKAVKGEKEEAIVVPLQGKKMQWLRVAAVVFIFATGGALTYSWIANGIQKDMAREMATVDVSKAAPQQDSIQPAEQSATGSTGIQTELFQKPAATSPVVDAQSNPPATSSFEDRSDNSKDMETAGSSREAANNVAADAAMSAPVLSREGSFTASPAVRQMQYEFKGKVTDEKGNPIPFATISGTDKNIGTSADAQGKFSLKAPDTLIQVDASSVGYDVAKAELKSNRNANTITLQQGKQSLSEVVVTGITSRRNSGYSGAATKMTTDRYDTAAVAEPIGGWTNFKQYVRRQIDSLDIDPDEFASQSINFEFNINKDGRPTNVDVPGVSNKETAEKAADILKKGPRWTRRTKDKRVKATVAF